MTSLDGLPPLTRRRVLALAAAGLAVPLAARAQGTPPAGTPLRIGIIGAGRIGGTLGGLWAKAGHPVLLSSRHPEELKDVVAGLGPTARAGTPEEAIAFGEVLFLAVPFKAYPQIGRDYGPALAGKVMLDAGNASAARDGEIVAEVQRDGIGVVSARYLPGVRLVRAFNTLGSGIVAREAHRNGAPVAIPIAGDDAEALRIASGLVRDAGFDPVVVGPIARAREFQMGAPGYGQVVPAPDLRQRLGLTE